MAHCTVQIPVGWCEFNQKDLRSIKIKVLFCSAEVLSVYFKNSSRYSARLAIPIPFPSINRLHIRMGIGKTQDLKRKRSKQHINGNIPTIMNYGFWCCILIWAIAHRVDSPKVKCWKTQEWHGRQVAPILLQANKRREYITRHFSAELHIRRNLAII